MCRPAHIYSVDSDATTNPEDVLEKPPTGLAAADAAAHLLNPTDRKILYSCWSSESPFSHRKTGYIQISRRKKDIIYCWYVLVAYV